MLRLYNTLTARKEPFEPAQAGHAKVYICGPTVYDFAHLGHGRVYVIYDVLVRHLRATGTKVTYVRNITDIDDKIIKRSAQNGEDPLALSARFIKAYHEDMVRLGNLEPDVEPKVSDHLEEIRQLITTLIDKGAAYESDGDVYFSVEKFPGYGKLSHRKLSDLEHGASGRTKDEEAERKRHPADFALWKKSPAGEQTWPSPWSPGRPGWHIECSAMSMKYLGESFDLHGGGLDLVFPHHENEIAQSEAATGKPFCKLWMHNGFVEVDKEKMSKSLGNFFTARDLFERVEPEAIRYAMLTVHYRAPINFEWTLDAQNRPSGFPQLEDAERRLEYLYTTLERLRSIGPDRMSGSDPAVKEIAGFRAALTAALDDDLNMPVAVAHAGALLKAVNDVCDRLKSKRATVSEQAISTAKAAFEQLGSVLGLGVQDPATILRRIRDRRAASRGISGPDVETKIAARNEARASKDFTRADAIRTELTGQGVELLDSPTGTTWRIS